MYRIIIRASHGHTYYLSDNNMSTPGVGPDSETNIDTFLPTNTDFAFLSSCLPEEIYHFSSKEKAEDVIKNLPFPYNEKCDIIEVFSLKDPVCVSLYYRIGKIIPNFKGVKFLHGDGTLQYGIPKESEMKFVDKKSAEEFIFTLENPPYELEVFKFHDFGPPDWNHWYKSSDGSIISNGGKIISQRTDIDLNDCVYDEYEIGIPGEVFYRICSKTVEEDIVWLSEEHEFTPEINEKTLTFHTLSGTKKYINTHLSEYQDIDVAEHYASGSPLWKVWFKLLSTNEIYNSDSQRLRTISELSKFNYGNLGIPKEIFYRIFKKDENSALFWLTKENKFKFGVTKNTLKFSSVGKAQRYLHAHIGDYQGVEIAEIYYLGLPPDWEWNYKVLSTGKVYTSKSQEIA